MPNKINLAEKLAMFSDHWNPRIVGGYNGNEIRLAKTQGSFVWHKHEATDELFLVLKGKMTLAFRDHVEVLNQGDLIIVPKGVEHCPSSEGECHLLVIDREGESNTGNVRAAVTRDTLQRV